MLGSEPDAGPIVKIGLPLEGIGKAISIPIVVACNRLSPDRGSEGADRTPEHETATRCHAIPGHANIDPYRASDLSRPHATVAFLLVKSFGVSAEDMAHRL